jgi:predicted PhzF superfamily epimerase YddE/YHI9
MHSRVSQAKVIPQVLVVEQGYEVDREGTVQVWATNKGADYDVRIAGNACFVKDIECLI